jgi:hypothetical protein
MIPPNVRLCNAELIHFPLCLSAHFQHFINALFPFEGETLKPIVIYKKNKKQNK